MNNIKIYTISTFCPTSGSENDNRVEILHMTSWLQNKKSQTKRWQHTPFIHETLWREFPSSQNKTQAYYVK